MKHASSIPVNVCVLEFLVMQRIRYNRWYLFYGCIRSFLSKVWNYFFLICFKWIKFWRIILNFVKFCWIMNKNVAVHSAIFIQFSNFDNFAAVAPKWSKCSSFAWRNHTGFNRHEFRGPTTWPPAGDTSSSSINTYFFVRHFVNYQLYKQQIPW